MKGNNDFFTDNSICTYDLRQQHVADNHFRMPRVGDQDGDVNNDQNNLFFLTPITSFFTDHLFFFVTWICNGNLLFVPPFATRSLKSLLGAVFTLSS